MNFLSLSIIPAILIVAFVLITTSVKILREYERAVIFTLGRFQKVKGPGLVLLFPFVQKMVRVDLRIQVIEIPTQDVSSHDNVPMKVDAVLYFNVVNPERAIIQVLLQRRQSRMGHHSGSVLPSRHRHARSDDPARSAGTA